MQVISVKYSDDLYVFYIILLAIIIKTLRFIFHFSLILKKIKIIFQFYIIL